MKYLRCRPGFRTAVRELALLCIGLLAGAFLAQLWLPYDAGCSKEVIENVRRGEEARLRKALGTGATAASELTTSTEETRVSTATTPTIHTAKIRLNQNQVDSSVKRPRTWKEELKPRQALYVGVITAGRFLGTRALAVNRTWGRLMPKLEFFSAPGRNDRRLPVVHLPDVDDTYPPQKKVYRMLKYMHDKYIDQFDWFMRADDDVYVRVPELLQFLSNLDPSEDLYIGSPGMGKKEDLERIKLLPHERYCMGGPGVILSRSLLKKLVVHLEECRQSVVVSWNEDLELGRCISRRLDVQCTWAYEVCTSLS